MIALTVAGEWRAMMDGLRMDLPRAIPGDRMVDFVPYPNGPLSDYFGTIAPFYRRTEQPSGWRRWFGGRSG
jgi:hypothetical protein